ncbi:MAG TPA: L-dopachrome tautomerase-related protein [Elainellaceae cyanobacterium]
MTLQFTRMFVIQPLVLIGIIAGISASDLAEAQTLEHSKSAIAQRTSAQQTSDRTHTETPVEIVAELEQAPGNVTLTPDGRIIFSLHQFYEPEYRVVELGDDNQLIPFPNLEWADGIDDAGKGLDAVLGIQADPTGTVWMLDNGGRTGSTPKLVAWNSATDELDRVIEIPPPVTEANSFVNDLAVDLTNQAVYIADTALGGTPALIVVDLTTNMSRRVLAEHVSVMPDADVDIIVEGEPIQSRQPDGSLVQPSVGVNPIALDTRNEWLYYGPMSGTRLYRIRTEHLLNPQLTDAELGDRVEDYGPRPYCDGISIDAENNIYISDLQSSVVGVLRPDRTYEPLAAAPWMNWIDAFSFGPDDYIYSVVNELHHSAPLNGGEDTAEPPFYIFRLTPLANGVVGR